MPLIQLKSSQFSLSGKSTTNLSEGTNQYFTNGRARGSISVGGNLAYNSGTGVISYSTPDSDGITEGSSNLYFTNARARLAVSATGDLSYNNSSGAFSYSTPALNAIPVPDADVAMNTKKITGLADGTNASDAVTKGQLDNAIAGLHWKESVKVATMQAGTLASSYANGGTVDGVGIATGDRILIKNQTGANQKENGIYVVKASGAPDRASDMNESDEFSGSAVLFSREQRTQILLGFAATMGL